MNARHALATPCIALLAVGATSPQAGEANAPTPRAATTTATTAAMLSPVVVTATTRERDAADAPASVSVIDGAALRSRPIGDLADAVGDTVGVGLDSVGLGRRGVSIRGMSPEHTLVLVDGQRINASASAIAHSDFELGWVPTEAIERVEVVRGPMSSLYGSEALGGVVNVITRAATDTWQGSASTYVLRNDHSLGGNQFKTGVYMGGPLVPGTLGLNAWGEYRRRDALRDAASRTLTALDEQRARTGHVGLTFTPDAHQRIDASAAVGDEDQTGVRGGASNTAYDAGANVQRRRYAITHSGDWAWGDSQVRAYRSTLSRDSWRSDGGDANGPNRFVDTVLDGRVGFAAGRAQRITLGAETRRESLEDPTVNLAGKKAQTHYAVFAQDEIVLGEQWELVLGTRLDHHADFGWEASPRAYLLYHPAQDWTLRAGAGRGFKAPSLKQLSPEYESWAAMGGRGIIRGNPSLQPETNQAFELGATYDPGPWSAGATLFHNDVRNLIETVRQPTCAVRGRTCLAYENVARARLQGLELTGRLTLSAHWQVQANYTWLDARDRTSDTRLPDRSRHRANATLAWTPIAPLTTRLRLEYVGSQTRAVDTADRPGYTSVHTYLDYAVNRTWSLQAGVENITDKRLANDEVGVYARADEGRRYYAGLTARF